MIEIEVKIVGISDLLKPSTSHALILEETYSYDSKRRLAIIIGDREAVDLRTCLMKYKTPRPLVHELTSKLLCEAEVTIDKAVIYNVSDGVYSSYIYGTNSSGKNFKVDARTTDALALSLKMDFPVYITDELLEREQIHSVTPDGSGFSMPLNSVATDMLKLDMEAAIKNEDYERAAILRDEIARRKNEPECK